MRLPISKTFSLPLDFSSPLIHTIHMEHLELSLEDLEADLDQPQAPRTSGSKRPQALRQARARRSALKRQLGL